MESPLREQFMIVTMRFKKMDVCPSSEVGLQPSELAVMGRAYKGCGGCEGKGMNVSDIQQNLHISKPAVSQTLNNLERKGYLIRAIDPVDRRKIAVTLTPAGEKVLEDSICIFEEALDRILDSFGVENAKTLIALMNKLMDILDECEA